MSKRPMVLMSTAIVLTVLVVGTTAWPFVTEYKRWHDSEMPIKYYIAANVPSWAVQPIINAFDTWTDVTASYVSYERTTNVLNKDIYIDWGSLDGQGNTLAQTTPYDSTDSDVNKIWYATMRFDEAENWDISGSPDPGEVDVESIALHEVGHTIHLGESLDPEVVMYQEYNGVQRSLAQDDKNGAIFTYPESVQQAVNIAYDNSKSKVIISKSYSQNVSMKGGIDLIGSSFVGPGGGINGTVSFQNLGNSAGKLKSINVTTAYPKHGVYLQNSNASILKSNIKSTNYIGIRCYYYSDPAIDATKVYDSTHGVYASDYSDPKIFRSTGPNNIVNNSQGVHCRSYAKPDLGVEGPHPGDNNFDNQSYDVYAYTDADLLIKAESNYWGENPPNSSEIYHANPEGVIDYIPYDTGPNAKPALGSDRTALARTLYRLGAEAYSQGRYEEALGHAKIVVEDYPETEFAPHALACIFRSHKRMSRLAEVYPYLEVIADQYPHTELGRVALELSIKRFLDEGDFTKARARAEQIIAMFPDEKERNDSLSFLLCWTYEASGEMEKARQAYAAFLQEYPLTRKDGTVRDLSVLAMLKLGFEPPIPEQGAVQGPESVLFLQNTPNPFNPQTTLSFALPKAMQVRVAVYNILGQEVRVLVDGVQSPGIHTVLWDGRDAQGIAVGSGLYFARLEAEGTLHTRKLLLVR